MSHLRGQGTLSLNHPGQVSIFWLAVSPHYENPKLLPITGFGFCYDNCDTHTHSHSDKRDGRQKKKRKEKKRKEKKRKEKKRKPWLSPDLRSLPHFGEIKDALTHSASPLGVTSGGQGVRYSVLLALLP